MHTALRSSTFLSAWCLIAAAAALMVLTPPAAAAGAQEAGFDADHRVTFRSGATPADKLNFNRPHAEIAGYLYPPEGEGPFPAVVLVPDNEGLHAIQKEWVLRLVQWGYAVLAVDSRSRAGQSAPSGVVSAHDAYGALRHLAGQPFIDPQRIVWMGWSVSGAQAIVESGGLDANPNDAGKPLSWLVSEGPWRFQAGIAFYPSCPAIEKNFYAPVLMLVPGKNSKRAEGCKALAARSAAGGEAVRIRYYPDATHRFDVPGVTLDQYGDRAEYDPAAAQDAIAQVQAFLAEDRSGGWGHYLAKLVRRGWSWVSGK